MEKRFESWFRNQQIDWQSTDPNSSSARFCFGNMISSNVTNRNLPVFEFPKEQLPLAGSTIPKKKFLVFDQSNNRTTLIYSSTPVPYLVPNPQFVEPKRENPVVEKHADFRVSSPFLDDRNDSRSEMREDTEELNALLYSDDDEIDYSEDEEEQSTGHSPIPIPIPGYRRYEEVASCLGPRKRKKLENGGYDVVSLEDTASSAESGVNCSGEPELSSSGNNSGVAGNGSPEIRPESGKRSRKEQMRETISILENLIPGGKNGKDAMMILDEAINYLRILKVKAKALGLDSL